MGALCACERSVVFGRFSILSVEIWRSVSHVVLWTLGPNCCPFRVFCLASGIVTPQFDTTNTSPPRRSAFVLPHALPEEEGNPDVQEIAFFVVEAIEVARSLGGNEKAKQ